MYHLLASVTDIVVLQKMRRSHSLQLARNCLTEMVASRSVDHLRKLQEERDYLMGLDEDERVSLDSNQLALILHGKQVA